MPEEQKQIRANTHAAAKRARPYGEREETRYPVHAAGVRDIELRGDQITRDQTDELLIGEMVT
jgi:hypothetical protein